MQQNSDDAQEGITWWNGLDRYDRAYWLARAGSARPVDAWTEYKSAGRPTVDQELAS